MLLLFYLRSSDSRKARDAHSVSGRKLEVEGKGEREGKRRVGGGGGIERMRRVENLASVSLRI